MDFAEFYRATSPRTLRYAYGLTGDLAQAQDVVQEAYIRAWQRWRRLSGYDDAEAWLRLVVSRLVFDWWRHLRVRRNTPQPGPGAVAPPSEDTMLVVAALRKLPERQRHALALHYLLDVSVAQIAAELGVSEGTVKSWLSRGRDNLAAVLKDDLASVALPGVRDVEERGRRRRRARVAAAATAAGLAVLAVVVFATAILGRDRTMPLPPAVTPTGSPMLYTPMQRIGSVAPPNLTAPYGIVVDGGRAYVLSADQAAFQVIAVDLTTAKAAWPQVSYPLRPSDRFRMVVAGRTLLALSDKEAYAVALDSGKLLWHKESTIDPDEVAVFAGVAVFNDRAAGRLTGIDPATGAQRWQIDASAYRVFGMLDPADLNSADTGIGVPVKAYAGSVMFAADDQGAVTEYSAATGMPTGRAWRGVPASGYLAYNGEIYFVSARELIRLNLADGRQTVAYAGSGVVGVAPCGATGVCVVDATVDGRKIVAAIHDDHVTWSVTYPQVMFIAPAGRALRVSLGIDRDSVVLDESGHETLRLAGPSGLMRVDAGNMVGYRMLGGSGTSAELTGIAVASMRQTPLGTLSFDTGTWFVVAGPVLVTIAGRQVVVYRIG